MNIASKLGPSGSLSTKVIRREIEAPVTWKVKNFLRPANLFGYMANAAAKALSAITGIPTLTAELSITKITKDGQRINYGVVGRRVVTDEFVNDLVDELQSAEADFSTYKWHDSGEGTTAEAAGDTDIETTDGESRDEGTQTENGSNVYQSVGTINYTSTKAITEHGLFNASTAGKLMDRTVFSAIDVDNGDAIKFTYDLTVNSGN